jgi:putative ABC transport system permease protein
VAQLRAAPSRFVAVVLAVVLGVGFVAAIAVFTSTFTAGMRAAVGAEYAKADVVVLDATGLVPDADRLAAVTATPGVAGAQSLAQTWVGFRAPQARGGLQLGQLGTDDRLRWLELQQGREPTGDAEVLVDRITADRTSLTVGSTLDLAPPGVLDGGPGSVRVTVVGIADSSASALAGASMRAWGTTALLERLQPDPTGAPVAVLAAPGTDVPSLGAALQQRLGPDAEVRTSSEQADADLAAVTGDSEGVTTVLLGFAAVAVLAAAIVVTNTFTILLTQRTRAVALLRCVGATTGQVRRQVLAEALLLGTVGSVLGAGLGIGVGALGASLLDLDAAGTSVPLVALLATVLGGVLLTVVAAAAPATRAARTAPLAALHAVPDTPATSPGRGRLALAVVLVLAGGALLALGVLTPSLLVALPGGALAAVGLLLLTPWFLPPVIRLLGRPARAAGVPGALAVANSVRHPRRAAAAAVGLMLGVGLMVTLQVGASTAQTSLEASLAARYPVDVTLTAVDAAAAGPPLGADVPAIPADLPAQVAAVPGVRDVLVLPGGPVLVDELPGDPVTLLGADVAGRPEAVPAVLADALRSGRDVLVVPWSLLGEGGPLQVGQSVTVRTPTAEHSFAVAGAPIDDLGATAITVVAEAPTVSALVGRTPPIALWASVPDADDLDTATAALQAATVDLPGAGVLLGGSAPERAALQEALGRIVLLATGLLAVAVVIALVGIANTMSLSVLERTRESGLLRALGLRRGQLLAMLVVEAVLLAVSGTVVGVLAGLAFGWVGAAAALGEAGGTLVLSVPWLQLTGMLALAVVAGIVAAVLPARRAARTAPVAALADVG